jgi:hypothetical protein
MLVKLHVGKTDAKICQANKAFLRQAGGTSDPGVVTASTFFA